MGAEVKQKTLSDGRVERYILGGHAIGIPDDRHIITIAGSRAGKGRSVLIPNLITYPGSVLTIDPKGDLARFTAEYRADILDQKVIVLDPFGVAGESANSHSGGFNPMTILEEGVRKEIDDKERAYSTILEDAGLIADSLIIPAPGSKDPHWDETAKQFLEGVILHVATSPSFDGRRDLVSVYRAITEDMDDLKKEMPENTACDFAVATAAANFFDKSDNERSGVLSTLRRHIRFLGYRQIQKVLQSHSFDLAQLKKEQMTVYLSLPAMRMGTCARWLRLFVNLTLAALEKERAKPAYPVLMCLDEFAVLGPMKVLEDAAGQIAGLGCKLWPVLQDLGQLQSLYEKRWETFIGNAGILQFFGNSDMQTLEWISKRLGETTIQTQSRNLPLYEQRAQGNTGQSYSQQVHRLMTAEEISRFFGRDDHYVRQLIIRPTFQPIVLQRVHYDSHELFKAYRDYMRNRGT